MILTGPTPPGVPDEVPSTPFSSLLVVILAGFGGFAMVVLLGLTWWFRKDDRRFRDRLQQYRSDQVLELPTTEPSPDGLMRNAETGITIQDRI